MLIVFTTHQETDQSLCSAMTSRARWPLWRNRELSHTTSNRPMLLCNRNEEQALASVEDHQRAALRRMQSADDAQLIKRRRLLLPAVWSGSHTYTRCNSRRENLFPSSSNLLARQASARECWQIIARHSRKTLLSLGKISPNLPKFDYNFVTLS